MKKTAAILTAAILILFATGQTKREQSDLTDLDIEASSGVGGTIPGCIRFGDIPQETPMYTAWGVDVKVRGIVDTANNASNIAVQAYSMVSNVYSSVTNAEAQAIAAASNAVLAADSAERARQSAEAAQAEIAVVKDDLRETKVRVTKVEQLSHSNSNRIDALEQRVPMMNKYVALFLIPLNSDSITNSFSEVELKASTNNFSHAVPGDDLVSGRLLYWGTSICTKNSLHGRPWMWPDKSWDNMWAYSCDIEDWYPLDARSWCKWKDYGVASLGHDLANPYPRFVAVIVTKEMLHRPAEHGSEEEADKDWFYSENDDLVWSYLRVSNGEPEKYGGKPVWNVCQPVKWLKKIPNWAYEEDCQRPPIPDIMPPDSTQDSIGD